MSLHATNQEVPVCPECHEPLRDPVNMFGGSEFDVTVDYVKCWGCKARIRVIMKRLYDTEVVT